MFSAIDRIFIDLATRLMRHISASYDITAPKVLRESLMAFLASYTAFGLAVLVTGEIVAKAAVVLCGAAIVTGLVKALQDYAADADKDWSSQLAMKYMAKAVGKQEGMRFARLIGWISLGIYPAAIWLTGLEQPSLFSFVYYAAMISGLVHEYLSAAEPTAPGERRHASQLQMAHANLK